MEWIKCSDKLPKLNEAVLATNGRDIYIAELWDYGNKNEWVESFEPMRISDMTHWQPLPNLPPV